MFNSTNRLHLSVADFLERQEEGFHLLFLNETGQCYALNDTGQNILALLRDGEDFEQICDKLSQRYSIRKSELRIHVANYLSELEAISMVQEAETSKKGTEVFEVPTIAPLENVFEKSEQCLTFGMPKRSCKALPSGLSSVGKK